MKITEKLRSIPKGVKASVALIFSSFVSSGIAYITTPLYTRLLTAEEYGQVSVFLTWLQVFGIVAMFSLSAGVFNNGMSDYPDKRDEFSFSMLILSNVITLCFYGALLCLYPMLRPWIGLDWPLMLLMGVIFLFQPAHTFWATRQRYELKYKFNIMWSIVLTVASPLIAIICIVLSDDHRMYARIFGAEITMIVIYVGFYVYLAVKSKLKVNTKYWKAAFLFNLPLIPHYLSMYLLGSSDKLMISRIVGDSATAYYSVAYSVASVAGIIWSAVNASLIPYTYEKCKKKEYGAISGIVLPILTLSAACCILVIMLAPEVVAVMATSDYREAIYAIPPIVGGVFFQMHYAVYANVVYYYKKPKYVMFASVVSAISNVILNFIFIPIFGFIAAGYTTLFSYFLQAVIDYFAMRKTVNGETVYNMKYIGVLSLGVIVVALCSNLVYDYAMVRYAIIGVTVVIAFLFRNRIIQTIKQVKSR